MVEPTIAVFMWKPALLLGAVIGLYEIILIHRDVTVATHRFMHGIHALLLSIFFVFVTLNTPWAIANFGLANIQYLNNVWILRAVVGLIAAVKIHSTSAAIKSHMGGMSLGLKETWAHSIIIGALIAVAPAVWPFVAPVLPAWAK